MRTWLSRPILAAVAAALAGCAVVEELEDALTPHDQVPVQQSAVPTASAEAAGTGQSPEDAAADDIPRPKRKPEIVDPKTLVGLDKTAVAALFGEPHRIIMSEPAIILSWQADGCEMRLYFYPDVADRTFRALTYEINAPEGQQKVVLQDTCASRLKWANAEKSR